MNPAHRLAQLSFTAGPAALLAGWFLMRPIHGGLEPGPWWTAAHVVWLAGFLMIGVMTLALRGLAGPVTGRSRVAVEVVSGLALFGVAANVVQLVIDLYTGLAAADGEAMRGLLDAVRDYPGVEQVVYGPGAQLYYAALLAQAVVLAALRRVTPVSAAVTAGGVVLLAVATFAEGRGSALVALGMAVMWLGTLLMGRGTPGTRAQDAAMTSRTSTKLLT
ncbi:hypothetical protein [Nonomuraea gerenzanensis]|uniref:Integral membrane protein n=1 Tax=Nonomuraea gerenzanensis TaxID=93944 RepID=A0A1M4E4W1_9ACTN|nr:hypothetical protein [Nonomuraea gerenzanensis]UBU16068.1 hypothetical protein LCN96_13975 [Nonomuraea gerenzanensis]SBO93871.1 hypothetical protein BN4615_P3387 [Nonomuraea gerenzanensis]